MKCHEMLTEELQKQCLDLSFDFSSLAISLFLICFLYFRYEEQANDLELKQ